MEYENRYMQDLERFSDDEIFEILLSDEEREIVEKYTAAISIALKRELISEYQSMELLDGNTKVLEYNPESVGKNIFDYQEEEKQRTAERRRFGISNLHYGLLLCLCGVILIFISQSSSSFFPGRTLVAGALSIGAGCLFIIRHFLQKRDKSF